MLKKPFTPVSLYLLLLHAVVILALLGYADARGWLDRDTGRGQSPAFSHFYSKTLQMQRRQDELAEAGAVIVIGDSLVHGLAVQHIAEGAVNYGISGDTTAGVLHRLPLYRSLRKARLVIIAVGINDLSKSGDEAIEGNFRDIAEALPGDVPVLINLLLPVDEKPMGLTGYSARIDRLNGFLNGLCARQARLECLDVTARLADSAGRLKSGYHTGDGLHLNDEANRIWLDALGEAAARLAPPS